MTESDNIINFLKENGSILPKRKIEEKAKIPFQTLQQAMGPRNKIPTKHLPSLIKILSQYGYKSLNPDN